jgi:hypothetical protein
MRLPPQVVSLVCFLGDVYACGLTTDDPRYSEATPASSSPMPYTPILATLGYVLSPDRERVLMIHRNARDDDHHIGKYNGLGGKLEANEDVAAGMRREIREEATPSAPCREPGWRC